MTDKAASPAARDYPQPPLYAPPAQQCPDSAPHGHHEWWFSKKANYWCAGIILPPAKAASPVSSGEVIVRIPICRRCERPITEHSIFHDPPTAEQLVGLVESDFSPFVVQAMYCPKRYADAPTICPTPITGSQEWCDEVHAYGCYRCGHESSLIDPCDEDCEGLPLSWSQVQAQLTAPDNTDSPVSS